MSKEQVRCARTAIRDVFRDPKHKGAKLPISVIYEEVSVHNQFLCKRIEERTLIYHLDKFVKIGILGKVRDGTYVVYYLIGEFPEIDDIDFSVKKEEKKDDVGVKDTVDFKDAMEFMWKGGKIRSNNGSVYSGNNLMISREGDIGSVKKGITREEMDGQWVLIYDVPECPLCGARALMVEREGGYRCECTSGSCGCTTMLFPSMKGAVSAFKVRKE